MDAVKIGDRRAEVEARLGSPVSTGQYLTAVYASNPMLVVTYDRDDAVEVVEAGYSGHHGGDEIFFEGVQLTYRFMDDVVADLAAMGHLGTPYDIGFVFKTGFAIYSNSSLWALDLDPNATEDDERRVVEGVSIASRAYFGD
ncbi:hypothetical protein ACFQZ4_51005 [Catellatospora coxensis]|uniref:Uncharacterized protein n=1 Tax=Catellatospora coxensis TaxID=310354 RepID=A0A8J3PDV9_9ACTN|nr:hypothetical protein [Catellatospora coxensis]GIG11501.1 hypothetical protein Cco03nite_82010 [Catellatospora coxensis]